MNEDKNIIGGNIAQPGSLESVAETLAEQLQAGHRSRLNGTTLQGIRLNNVQFHEVLPDATYSNAPQESEEPQAIVEQNRSTDAIMPEAYLNYAAQLLEQMRGVYSTSWDTCSNGGTWHGGHNHFYNPCNGVDVPPTYGCPTYDCTNTCGCNNVPQPAPVPPAAPEYTCAGGTATYYDDCAYKLQKISDQLSHIETMTNEMYSTNQQLFSYLIEYYNAVMNSEKSK